MFRSIGDFLGLNNSNDSNDSSESPKKESMDSFRRKTIIESFQEKLIENYAPKEKLHLFGNVCDICYDIMYQNFWSVPTSITSKPNYSSAAFGAIYSVLGSTVNDVLAGNQPDEQILTTRFHKFFNENLDELNKNVIPEKYVAALKNLIDNYEEETELRCQITFDVYKHRNAKLVLGKFKERTGIRVTKMIPGCEELIGTYHDFKELENKIRLIAARSTYNNLRFDESERLIGNCIQCGKEDTVATYSSCSCGTNGSSLSRCRSFSQLDNICIGYEDGNIYTSSGGSIGILKRIGEFEFIVGTEVPPRTA